MVIPTSLPYPLLPLNSPETSLETVGGKGLNLSKLARAGFHVPDGFFIPTSCYQDFVEHNHLSAKIKDSLRDLNLDSPEDLTAASVCEGFYFPRFGSSPGNRFALAECPARGGTLLRYRRRPARSLFRWPARYISQRDW